MAALQGLTGLYGAVEEPHGETGRPASNWGTPADPAHAVPGDAHPKPTTGRVYGSEISTDHEVESVPLPGLLVNDTPDVHSSPYPTGLTHDPLVASDQMRRLHGQDLGGVEATYAVGTPYPTSLDQTYTESPNQTVLAKVPGQLKAGSDDTEQGYGTENGYGFAFGHQFRRLFRDPVPLDRTGTVHGERPFYGRHSVGQNLLDVDSPYGAAGDISTGMNLGDTPTGYPTPYEQPPNVTYRPTADYAGESPMSDGWMAG